MTPTQPPLPILSSVRQESPDFFMTEANADMVRQVREYLAGSGAPHPKRALIIGEPMSGKTALLALLAKDYPPEECVFYDMSAPLSRDKEIALFHALNTDAETGITSCLAMRPEALDALTLPDLISRLNAAQLWHIPLPDEAMLTYLVGKALAQRQLSVAYGVAEYAATRLPRRYAAAFTCARLLDEAALERRCAISVKLAAQCPEIFED